MESAVPVVVEVALLVGVAWCEGGEGKRLLYCGLISGDMWLASGPLLLE
jgi:hypothetical protein